MLIKALSWLCTFLKYRKISLQDKRDTKYLGYNKECDMWNDFSSSHLYIENIKWELELYYINLSFIHRLQDTTSSLVFNLASLTWTQIYCPKLGHFFPWMSGVWDLQLIITMWMMKFGFFKKWKSSVNSLPHFLLLTVFDTIRTVLRVHVIFSCKSSAPTVLSVLSAN